MSDATHIPQRRSEAMEYKLYFSVIFLVALPFAVIGWVSDAARLKSDAIRKSILYRAVAQAQLITPRIFSV